MAPTLNGASLLLLFLLNYSMNAAWIPVDFGAYCYGYQPIRVEHMWTQNRSGLPNLVDDVIPIFGHVEDTPKTGLVPDHEAGELGEVRAARPLVERLN